MATNVDDSPIHLVGFTTFELECIAYANPVAWERTAGLTGPEKQAVQRVVNKLKAANIRAQTQKINSQ